MEFDYILYDENEDYIGEEFSRIDNLNNIVQYFINIEGENYKIKDNIIIIDDKFLNNKKRKLIKKELANREHIKYSIDEVMKFEEKYLLFLGDGYFIATDEENINSTDLLLTANEWVIKKLLE